MSKLIKFQLIFESKSFNVNENIDSIKQVLLNAGWAVELTTISNSEIIVRGETHFADNESDIDTVIYCLDQDLSDAGWEFDNISNKPIYGIK